MLVSILLKHRRAIQEWRFTYGVRRKGQRYPKNPVIFASDWAACGINASDFTTVLDLQQREPVKLWLKRGRRVEWL